MADHTDRPKRTSSLELPSASELIDMLSCESPRRAVRRDYLNIFPDIFLAYKELAGRANLDVSWLEELTSLSLAALLEAVQASTTQLDTYIATHRHTQLYKRIFKALVVPNDFTLTDAIFVFGAASDARIARAVELYTQGVASRIIVSGSRPAYQPHGEAEAARMSRYAIAHDVPKSALSIEDASLSLPDNVKRTIDMLMWEHTRPASLTIIASNFVLRRAYSEWYKFTPWDIVIRPVAAHTVSGRFMPDRWYIEGESRRLVLNEYAKLVIEAKIDAIESVGSSRERV